MISTSGSCFRIRRMNLRASNSSSAMTVRILAEVIRTERDHDGNSESPGRSISHLERKVAAKELFKAGANVTQTYPVSLAISGSSQTRAGVAYFEAKRIITATSGDFD